MKIYYSKKETYNNVTIEIKAEDTVNYEIENKEEAFARISKFVEERLAESFN